MVLVCLVHNLIELAMASTALLGLVAFLFFSVVHELAFVLAVSLRR